MADQQLTITIRGQSQEAVRAMKDATVAMGQLVGASVEMERGLTRSAATAETRLASLARRGADVETAMRGMATGVAVAAAPMVAATKIAVDYDKALRSVDSIAKLTPAALQSLGRDVIALARDPNIAQGPTQLAEGLYQVYSSGQQGAEALETLKVAAIGATAGLTSTTISAKALLAVQNSGIGGFNGQREAMDILFRTVDLGVLSFEELASSIGAVLPAAKNAGVTLPELGAAIAVMTRSGQSAGEATNDLLNLITKLVRPPAEAEKEFKRLGIAYGANAIQAKGLGGVLEEIATKTRGNSQALAELFPDLQASRGAVSLLANEGRSLRDMMGGMEDATKGVGAAMSANERVLQSTAAKWEQAKAKFEAVSIELGSKLLPKLNDFLDFMGKHADVAAFAVQVGAIAIAINQVTQALNTLGAAKGFQWLMGTTAGPFVARLAPPVAGALAIESGLTALGIRDAPQTSMGNPLAGPTALPQRGDARDLLRMFGPGNGVVIPPGGPRGIGGMGDLIVVRPGGRARGEPVPVLPPASGVLPPVAQAARIAAISDEEQRAIAEVRERYRKELERARKEAHEDPVAMKAIAGTKVALAEAEEREVAEVRQRYADQRAADAKAATDRETQQRKQASTQLRADLDRESQETLQVQRRTSDQALKMLEARYRGRGDSDAQIAFQLADDKANLLRTFLQSDEAKKLTARDRAGLGDQLSDSMFAAGEARRRLRESLTTDPLDASEGRIQREETFNRVREQGLEEAGDFLRAAVTDLQQEADLKREIGDQEFDNALALAQQRDAIGEQLKLIDLQVARRQAEQAQLSDGLTHQLESKKLEGEINALLQQRGKILGEVLMKQVQAAAASSESFSHLADSLGALAKAKSEADQLQLELERRTAEAAGPGALRAWLEAQRAAVQQQIAALGTPGFTEQGKRSSLLQLQLQAIELDEQLEKLRPAWLRFWSDLADEAGQSLRRIGEGALQGVFENLLGGRKQDVFKQLLDDLRSLTARSLSQAVFGGLEGLFRGDGGGLFGGIFGGGRRSSGDPRSPNFVGPPEPGMDITAPTKSITKNVPAIALGLAGLVMTLTKGKNDLASTLVQVVSVIASIGSMIPGGWGGIFSGIGDFFGGLFADGGDPPMGKVSIVGERGPELFVPRTPGTIIPNHVLARSVRLGMPAAAGRPDLAGVQLGAGGLSAAGGNLRQVVRDIIAELGTPQVNVTQHNSGPINANVDLERSARELGWVVQQRLRTA